MYRKKLSFTLPAWVLPLGMAVLGEVLVYLWTMDLFVPGRFAAIAVFGLGLGSVLAFISSLFPGKSAKWAAGIIAFLEVFVFAAEFLINDTFQVFMGADTIGAGAVGVVTNYMRIVVDEIVSNWWQILVLLIPIILYALLIKPQKVGWRSRVALVLVAVLMYALGFGVVHWAGIDEDKLTDDFNFDKAVRAFGVHMGFVVDALHDFGVLESELDFDFAVETTSQTTVPGETEGTESTIQETVQETIQETVPATEPPVVFQPHAFEIDYAALAQTETNANVAALHSYVASQTAAMENEYTGLFKGKNLIMITAEAFSGAVISPETTPTLYRLATEGIYFTDYYQPVWGSGTTGGEYTNLVGLSPAGGDCMQETLQQDLFLTMGNQLKKQGYSSAAFHNNDYTYYDRDRTHPLLGYDYFMGYGNGIEAGVKDVWPQSDLEMIDFTVPLYIDQQPFSVYYMTVSGHSSYYRGSAMVNKHYDKFADLKIPEALRGYYATQQELEAAMTSLLAQLEQAGILDDTVIVLGADHYPYGLVTDGTSYIDELMGLDKAENDITRDKNTLIIWSGCIEDMDIVVDDPVMSLDILPTLSNLFGVEYDSRLLVGRDVFSDTDPLVYWGVTGSWKTDKGYYLNSAYKFFPNEGVEVDADYVSAMHKIVRNKIKYSKGVAGYDYFNYVKAALTEDTTAATAETTTEIATETTTETTTEAAAEG